MGKKVVSNIIRAAVAMPTFGFSEVVGRDKPFGVAVSGGQNPLNLAKGLVPRPPSLEGNPLLSTPTEADAQKALEERKRKLDEEAQERRRQLVVSPIATGGLGLPGVLTTVRRSVLG